MKTTVYTHPAGLAHDTGISHPERGERLQVLQQLLEHEDFRDLDIVEPDKATDKQLARAHTADYIDYVRESSPEMDRIYLDYGDTVMSPGSLDAALYAAGAVCRAVDDVLTFKTRRAFCMNRPPGHHAEPDRALGFCLFNSIFIGAMQAIAQYDCNKIVIVDFDVHHGNGTDSMTRQEEHAFYISTHEWPLFPGTGNPEIGRASCRERVFPVV